MRNRLLLWAAMGAVGLVPRIGLAQYRVGTQGHALDANNQLGSGGINGVGQNVGQQGQPAPVTANDIFMGNVTGLSAFQGGVPYRNPYAFTGGTPYTPSEILQQQAGGNLVNGQPTYGTPQLFYPRSQTAVTPPGFETADTGLGYVPTPQVVQQSQDYRLGNTLDVPTVSLPHPDEATGIGQVDPTASMTPSYLSSAPLFGATLLSPLLADDQSSLLNQHANGSVITTPLSGLSRADIMRLRGEVALSAGNSASTASNPANTTATGEQPITNAAPINSAVPQNNLAQNPLPGGSVAPASGDFSTGQSNRQIPAPLPLPPPGQQSPQYAKLKELLDEYQSAHPKNEEEANRLFEAALKARREYEESLVKGPGSGGAPGSNVLPGGSTPGGNSTPPPNVPPPAPLEIGSIGKSINAAGLSKLVQAGEDLARHQQFKDAIAKFMDAREVAPNNTLIVIDLANAELGAGFYQQAEQYLREAFTADPALLMGKYDLTGVIGDDRLQILISDLKRVASSGDNETPVFLLAYLSYNMGENPKAVEYLKLAQSRAGGEDPLIQSLGEHWMLEATVPASQPSK